MIYLGKQTDFTTMAFIDIDYKIKVFLYIFMYARIKVLNETKT